MAWEVNDIPLRVLNLNRIIESKRATNRDKDRAVLPALEAAFAARPRRATHGLVSFDEKTNDVLGFVNVDFPDACGNIQPG